MAGFENDVMLSKNLNFDEAGAKPHLGIINAAGLLPIGTGQVQPIPEILAGRLTSPLGTITIGYASPNITLDLAGGASAIEKVALQTGTSPIIPLGGQITFNGATVAAGTNPVRTDGTGANTMALEVQISQAIAAGDATKIGLSNFDSVRFTVSAAGFVSINGAGVGETITGDSGGALNPTAGNWNIFGLSGSKTSGSSSTLTIKSPPYADQAAPATITLNSGSFATAAITLTTPLSAGLATGDLIEFVATNGVLVIQLQAGQVAHLGSAVTSAGGTITGTATGDSISLRYQSSTDDFWATSSVGIWILA